MRRKQKSERLVEIRHDSHGEPGPFIDCSEYRLHDESTTLALLGHLNSSTVNVLESACVRDRGQRGGMSQVRGRRRYCQQLPDATVRANETRTEKGEA